MQHDQGDTIIFNEAFVNVVSKSALDFVAVAHEKDGCILFANESGAQLFEYVNAARLTGVHVAALLKCNNDVIDTFNNSGAERNISSFEVECITKSGHTFWGFIQINPFTVEHINYLLIQIEKIDRAKYAEQTLQLEKQRFSTLMNYLSIGVVIVNMDHEIILANRFAAQLFGYSQSEMTGKKIEILIPKRFHPTHHVYHDRYFEKPVSRPMGVNMEIYGLKKDGTEFPVDVSLAHFQDNNTNFTIAFIADNTTEQKRLKEVKANEERFRLLIEHTPAAVAMFDTEMRHIMVSRRWVEDFRLEGKDVIGCTLSGIFPGIYRRWETLSLRCLEGETLSSEEELIEFNDGHRDWIKWEMCPWFANENKTGGIILFTEVVTKRKQAETALQQLNLTLEKKVAEKTKHLSDLLDKEKELGELKSKFVTIASHEFRTPLSTILSSAYLLEKYETAEDQPKRVKHIERIVSSISMLTDILNDFLSLGKIEEGKITPRFNHFNVKLQMEETLKELNLQKRARQQINYSHKGATEIFIDPSLLKHIVINLVTNAIKFSHDDGAIFINTQLIANTFIVSVKDNGIGISKDDLQHLFQRFFRGANASAIQGTGLGLHIVQKYAELMNGIIGCSSTLDEGTEFKVTFRLK